jgi:hypothetical protein
MFVYTSHEELGQQVYVILRIIYLAQKKATTTYKGFDELLITNAAFHSYRLT